MPLGFANGSLVDAIKNQPVESDKGEAFRAFVIPKACKTFIKED